ncbi:MAG: hypothetical protein DMENIID0002_00900 [Rickettsia endosymbiont of Sergentomyia squamirostris]|uniref:Uncharacterized protein n=1 Tax=Candidatus Tisiphia endosymbiont of Sergentomyia squamirostris TaxID=3113639 RepID=A0AAT9G6N1_9RICK
MILIDTLSKVVKCNKFVNVQGGKNMGRNNKHNQGDWANHFRKYNFSKQDKPLSKEVEPLKLYTAKDMLLLTTLSMIRSKDNIDNSNSIDNIDNLSAHYIAKRAISEGYTNAGYTLENTTTPKHTTPEKSTSHNQDSRTIMLSIGGAATGCVIIGIVACEAYKSFGSKNKNVDLPIVFPIEVCESSDSKNKNIDCSVDTNLSIITIPLEEIQDISLAGNTTTQVEQ